MNRIRLRGLLLLILLMGILHLQDGWAGTIYYIDSLAPTIRAVSSTNGAIINYFGLNENLGQPNGMAVDTNGSLYVAYTSSNTIIRYTTTGQSIYTTQVTNPYVLMFDNNGNLFSANSDQTISKISANGSTSLYATLPAVPSGLVFDRSGTLYANMNGNAIEAVSTNGTVSTFATISASSQSPSGLAIDANGNLFAMTYYVNMSTLKASPSITEISNDGVTNLFLIISDGIGETAGPVIDGNGNLYFCNRTGRDFGGTEMVPENGTPEYISVQFPLNGGFMAYSPFDVPLSDLPDTPTIIRQPQSQTAAAGSTVIFGVSAEIAPFTYQWYFNATNLIPGATNATLVIGNVQGQQSGSYSVVVSNSAGSTNSQPAYLNVLPSLTINMVPAISLFGTVGTSYNIQYINAVGATNAPWISLATVTLTNSPQFYPDYSAIGQPQRFYRTVQLP